MRRVVGVGEGEELIFINKERRNMSARSFVRSCSLRCRVLQICVPAESRRDANERSKGGGRSGKFSTLVAVATEEVGPWMPCEANTSSKERRGNGVLEGQTQHQHHSGKASPGVSFLLLTSTDPKLPSSSSLNS